MAARRRGDICSPRLLIVLAALVCALWRRSRENIDMFALFVGSDGRAQVLASSDGRVCIALTNVRFGRERAWTAMHDASGEISHIIGDLDVTRIQIYPPPDPAKVAAGAVSSATATSASPSPPRNPRSCPRCRSRSSSTRSCLIGLLPRRYSRGASGVSSARPRSGSEIEARTMREVWL